MDASGRERSRKSGRRDLFRLIGTAGAALLVPVVVGGQSAGQRGAPERAVAGAGEEDVTPPEDLMREHGVLKRVLLIYGEAIRRIDAGLDLPPDAVRLSADIIRNFIENYHEKLEEDYVFPRFEKAGRLVELTRVLRAQHAAGRELTERILRLAASGTLKAPASARELAGAMQMFIRMYNPHEAREDTVLFPAFRSVVPGEEFGALGEEFEKKERALFGEDGFERVVDRVAGIERSLGIEDLSQFTPRL